MLRGRPSRLRTSRCSSGAREHRRRDQSDRAARSSRARSRALIRTEYEAAHPRRGRGACGHNYYTSERYPRTASATANAGYPSDKRPDACSRERLPPSVQGEQPSNTLQTASSTERASVQPGRGTRTPPTPTHPQSGARVSPDSSELRKSLDMACVANAERADGVGPRGRETAQASE